MFRKKGDAGFIRSYWTRWGMSSKLRELQNKLNSLTNVSDQFTPRSHGVSDKTYLRIDKEPMIAPDNDSFRRKQDKENIIQRLLHPSNSSVVVIAGMFGVGKTTLAHVVKNDSRIQHYFDHKLWVSVSGDFNLMKVLCSIILNLQLEQTQEVNSSLSPPEQQYARLFLGLCKERRVLIVLDDLCSFRKSQDWEDFQSLLLNPSCGFGILITTRNPKVATTITSLSSITSASYHLQQMSDEDCGSIIEKKAVLSGVNKRMFCGRRMSEVIAVQIAQKFCKGLPLVANVIGHQLSLKEDHSWPSKLSKDLWTMPEFRELIFPTLKLNYSDFSIFLKNCYPYFSLFPLVYDYTKDDLVRLWLAEGYVKPQVAGFQYSDCSEYSVFEELGNYYFDTRRRPRPDGRTVRQRAVGEVVTGEDRGPTNRATEDASQHISEERKADGGRSTGVMVEYSSEDGAVLLQFFLDEQFVGACSSGNVNGDSSYGVTTQYRNSRHLSLLSPSIPMRIWRDIERYSEGLRTILSLREHLSIGQLSYTLFLKLQSLRVLNLSGTDISELPESMGKLKHLRLLDVSNTNIQEFPTSTTDLYMLQFLKADQCPLLLQLPKKMRKLVHLLHLEVDIKSLSSMPPSIGKLTNLCTLPAFIVGRKNGYKVTELKDMKYLQGSICVTNLENVSEVDAKEELLRNKPFLKRVELEWNKYLANQSERILSGFIPHENLEELQITGYSGTQFPSWISSRECTLTSIYLLRCDQCTILPALGQLQHLKTLLIEEMHCIEYIDNRFSGGGVAAFPSLESLKFQDMMSLKRWEGLQATQMPCLGELNITDCPNLSVLPSLHLLCSLVKLEISYCPVLQALPEGGFPLSMETLIIVQCDLLKQRCLPGQGDWEKIKAVRKVLVDFVRIQTLAG
uniref:NB-ARC domain-containing protein n=1 Tax=Chenopodium quinoa TaxID=63459 RepID=A0A803LT80_CHEQI